VFYHEGGKTLAQVAQRGSGGKTLAQVAQRGSGGPIPGNIQGQVGRGSAQPSLVSGVPAH